MTDKIPSDALTPNWDARAAITWLTEQADLPENADGAVSLLTVAAILRRLASLPATGEKS